MMDMAGIGYFEKERFWQDGVECGAAYLVGDIEAFGYTSPGLTRQQFLDHLRCRDAMGEALKRQQINEKQRVHCRIASFAGSVQFTLAEIQIREGEAGAWRVGDFVRACVERAELLVGMEGVTLRRGAGGVYAVEGMTAHAVVVHLTANDGSPSVHAHLIKNGVGRGADGKAGTVSRETEHGYYAKQTPWQLAYQQAAVDLAPTLLGVHFSMEAGRAVDKRVDLLMQKEMGIGSRSEKMAGYLSDLGIPARGRAKEIAARVTRDPEQEHRPLAERLPELKERYEKAVASYERRTGQRWYGYDAERIPTIERAKELAERRQGLQAQYYAADRELKAEAHERQKQQTETHQPIKEQQRNETQTQAPRPVQAPQAPQTLRPAPAPSQAPPPPPAGAQASAQAAQAQAAGPGPIPGVGPRPVAGQQQQQATGQSQPPPNGGPQQTQQAPGGGQTQQTKGGSQQAQQKQQSQKANAGPQQQQAQKPPRGNATLGPEGPGQFVLVNGNGRARQRQGRLLGELLDGADKTAVEQLKASASYALKTAKLVVARAALGHKEPLRITNESKLEKTLFDGMRKPAWYGRKCAWEAVKRTQLQPGLAGIKHGWNLYNDVMKESWKPIYPQKGTKIIVSKDVHEKMSAREKVALSKVARRGRCKLFLEGIKDVKAEIKAARAEVKAQRAQRRQQRRQGMGRTP